MTGGEIVFGKEIGLEGSSGRLKETTEALRTLRYTKNTTQVTTNHDQPHQKSLVHLSVLSVSVVFPGQKPARAVKFVLCNRSAPSRSRSPKANNLPLTH